MTKSNYLIRKVGTPYTQCVHRIRLRPIKPNYEVEDIQVTLDEFRPDPSLGKYRSEHEMFDEALELLSQEGRLYDPNVVPPKPSAEAEVEYLISGAAVAPPPNTAPTAPLVPPPPAPASAPLTEHNNQLFHEPAQPAAPTQVHTDKPQPGVSLRNTEHEYLSNDNASFASSANMNQNEKCSTSSAKHTSQQQRTTSRKISFDQYDYSRAIPNRHELTKSGYYSYLDKNTVPSSTDTKRDFLRKIASNTREKIVTSKIPVPQKEKTPEKPILKNRYPIRSNRGQPAPSSDIYSPQFQLNSINSHNDRIIMPQNIIITRGKLFDNCSNFGFCFSADLKFQNSIQNQIAGRFEEMPQVFTNSSSATPGSILAHLSQTRKNWIYVLILQNKHDVHLNYLYLNKCLCRMKSHMIANSITHIQLPQLGYEHNLEWRRVLFNIVRVFAKTNIKVQIVVNSVISNQIKANYIVPDNPPNNEEIRRREFHMCTARKLAFQGMMQNSQMKEANNN